MKSREKGCKKCDNGFCKFEQKYGSIRFLKAGISNINKILVEKGIVTEKEVINGMKEELSVWEKKE